MNNNNNISINRIKNKQNNKQIICKYKQVNNDLANLKEEAILILQQLRGGWTIKSLISVNFVGNLMAITLSTKCETK